MGAGDAEMRRKRGGAAERAGKIEVAGAAGATKATPRNENKELWWSLSMGVVVVGHTA